MPPLAARRQALEALVRDVLPRVLRLLPWGQRLGLQLHVAVPRGAAEPPAELAAQFKEHGTRIVYHGGLSEEQVGVRVAGWCCK